MLFIIIPKRSKRWNKRQLYKTKTNPAKLVFSKQYHLFFCTICLWISHSSSLNSHELQHAQKCKYWMSIFRLLSLAPLFLFHLCVQLLRNDRDLPKRQQYITVKYAKKCHITPTDNITYTNRNMMIAPSFMMKTMYCVIFIFRAWPMGIVWMHYL